MNDDSRHNDHDDHDRGHDHGHDHDHDHGHGHGGGGPLARLKALVAPHSHDSADSIDQALETSDEAVRVLWISLAALAVTAALQAVVVVISGSVALLGDTLHNLADAGTAVPLWLAFKIGRRAPTRRYTYGYGRSEDLAGLAVVVVIAASAAIAAWESIERLRSPEDVDHLPIVAAAGVIGFLGNEWVARYRIGVGRRIGSAALEADGLHARTDGLTSLAVVLGAALMAMGWEWADGAVGLLITLAILTVLRRAARDVLRRLLDAVDPALVELIERTLGEVEGVRSVGDVRVRWVGHRLRAEAAIGVDGSLSALDAHAAAERARHALLHGVPRLADALIHPDPLPTDGHDPHEPTAHHRP